MYQEIIDFWFNEIDESKWWKKDTSFDLEICTRFSEVLSAACCCELYEWRIKPEGRLAEIIILDQFSRNIYRNSALAFSNDALALALSQESVSLNVDEKLQPKQNSFLYMPYMHSESRLIHEAAETLYKNNGLENNYQYELKHKAIIDRFGRYPHRNKILGRESTAEEITFLQQPGSSF